MTVTERTEKKRGKVRDQARGYPSFAAGFPRDPALDALVAAFAAGDYRRVRDGAPALAAREDAPEEVRAAARMLSRQLEPDGGAKVLFALATVLLVFLTAWWVAHAHERPAPTRNDPPPRIEKID